MIETKTIPAGILKPGVYGELNTSSGSNALPANTLRLLLVAQKTAAGSQAALSPVQVFGSGQAATLFGPGSIAHRMARAVFAVNPQALVEIIALDDAASSVAATAALTLTGTATGSGSIVCFVGNERIEVGIASADTPTTIAANLVAAINAATHLPVTAANAAGVLTLTAKNKGTVGNQLALVASVSAASVTLSATSVAFTGGTLDPTLQNALDKAFPGNYGVYAHYLQDSTSCGALATHLNTISGAIEQRPARAVVGLNSATLATATTLSAALNNERMHIAYLRSCRTPGCELAAAVAASMAEESDPARPFNGKALPGIDAPDVQNRFSRTEQEALLTAGVTPLEVVDASVCIVRLVTTRTKTSGTADLTLLDTGTIASLDYTRLAVNTRLRLKFNRAKLNDMSLDQIKTQVIDVLYRLQDLEILQRIDQYKDYVTVERDTNAPGRVRLRIPAPIVPGLHQIFDVFDLIIV